LKIVLVTGSREWTDGRTIREAIGAEKPDLVVQGGAKGADRLAELAAMNDLDRHCARIPAQWLGRRGKGAGFVRNQLMVDLAKTLKAGGADVVVLAFSVSPPSPGTADCARRAREAGLTVKLFVEDEQ
jgi:hypothetical protein